MKDLQDIYVENYLQRPTEKPLEERITNLKIYLSGIYKGIESLQKHFRNGKAAKASRVILSEMLPIFTLLKTHILPSDRNFEELSIKDKLAQIQKLFGATHLLITRIKGMTEGEPVSDTLVEIENKVSVITDFFAEYVYAINRYRK